MRGRQHVRLGGERGIPVQEEASKRGGISQQTRWRPRGKVRVVERRKQQGIKRSPLFRHRGLDNFRTVHSDVSIGQKSPVAQGRMEKMPVCMESGGGP